MFRNSTLFILAALSYNNIYASLDNQTTPININQQSENTNYTTNNTRPVGTYTLINGLALAATYVVVSYIAKDLEENKQTIMLNSLVGLGLFTTMGCAFAEGVNFLDRMILHTTQEQKKPDLKKSLELNKNR